MGRAFRIASLVVILAVVAVIETQTAAPRLDAAGVGGSHKVLYVANGDGADLYVEREPADPNKWSQCGVGLNVTRSGASQAPETYLNYWITEWDPNFLPDPYPTDKCTLFPDAEFCTPGACRLVESGNGKIPNSSYRVNAQTQTLNVDTRDLPGFEYVRDWEGDPPRTTFGGVISVTWEKNSGYAWGNSGTSSQRGPGFSYRSTGTSTSSSADATGTLLDEQVSTSQGGEAHVGKFNGVSICWSPDENGCFGDGGK